MSVAEPDQPLPRPYPERILLRGRYVHLEPIDDAAHGDFLSFVQQVASRHSAAIIKALLAGRAP